MKQFFTNIAANLATIALLFLIVMMLTIGIIASIAGGEGPVVPDRALLIVDLSVPLADRPAERRPSSAVDRAFAEPGGAKLSLRAAVAALNAAATDDRISGVLLRGNVASDGLSSGYGGLVEFREALVALAESGKPVHAFLVNPSVRDYYVTSAANTITLDPFGTLQFTGLAATQVYFAGFLEKYGIGVQVSRVGRFKAAVEPFTRRDMSSENRAQTRRYLESTWNEIKRGVSASRLIDTARVQRLADSLGLFLPEDALRFDLVDRVAPFDVLLADLRELTGTPEPAIGPDRKKKATSAMTSATTSETTSAISSDSAGARATDDPADSSDAASSLFSTLPTRMPQITLRDYAQIVVGRKEDLTTRNKIAIVYAQGDIVDGEGGNDQVGGAAFARELRALRSNRNVRAVVLRVNSPGGSVVASEQIRRELALLNSEIPVVVSMGTLAASGGYWISTASRHVFAQPSTLTGSIGVFAIFPNLEGISEKNGITTDTVSTARYADLFSITRPRTNAELALVQRSVDAVYDSFLLRVADSRSLPLDSVQNIAEGRVWSGEDALALGLVDEIGDLEEAIAHAAQLAGIDDFALLEVPPVKSASDMFQEFLDDSPPPVVGAVRTAAGFMFGNATGEAQLRATEPLNALAARRGPMADALRGLMRDVAGLARLDDPRATYARLPFGLLLH